MNAVVGGIVESNNILCILDSGHLKGEKGIFSTRYLPLYLELEEGNTLYFKSNFEFKTLEREAFFIDYEDLSSSFCKKYYSGQVINLNNSAFVTDKKYSNEISLWEIDIAEKYFLYLDKEGLRLIKKVDS